MDRYEEALERGRKAIEDCGGNEGRKRMIYGILPELRPELKESEDVRIRKGLIDILESDYTENAVLYGLPKQKFITYLEKQGEQKISPGAVIKCADTGSLWVRCRAGDNRRSDGHTACIGGKYVLANDEEADQFYVELDKNGYRWSYSEGEPIKKEQKPALPGLDDSEGVPGKDFIPVEWVDACERYGKWEIVKKRPVESVNLVL